MPLYSFLNEKTQETKDIIMSMKDEHRYIDENGYEWTRIWYNPQTSISSLNSVDPFDIKKASEVTGSKCGTIGNLQDFAKELSDKRKDKLGKDPVLERHYSDYTKKRGGKTKHPDLIKKNNEKTYEVGD